MSIKWYIHTLSAYLGEYACMYVDVIKYMHACMHIYLYMYMHDAYNLSVSAYVHPYSCVYV
jgi:hypothetical protein